MEPGESFGPRLRQERERRHISLASIAANTKISVSLLEGLERDDVRRWPSGIFRRSFIRSYAQAIGMDPEVVLREFMQRFSDPAAPSSESARGESTPGTRQSSHIDIVLRLRVPRAWAGWLRWVFARRPDVVTVTEPEA